MHLKLSEVKKNNSFSKKGLTLSIMQSGSSSGRGFEPIVSYKMNNFFVLYVILNLVNTWYVKVDIIEKQKPKIHDKFSIHVFKDFKKEHLL